MRPGPSSIAAVVMAGALLLARDAAAYCRSTSCNPTIEKCVIDGNGCPRSGAPLTWTSLPLTYRFHASTLEKIDGKRAREAVRRAFDTWSNVSCDGKRTSLDFVEGPEIKGRLPKGTDPAKDNFGIYFREAAWPFAEADDTLALTNQSYGRVTGNIDYSDIAVNLTKREFALADDEAGIDLQAVVTHEVGHYIGLAHSRVASSIMIERYCESDNRCKGSIDAARALGEDDVAAVCTLYPPDGSSAVTYDDPAASSCASSPRSAPPTLPVSAVAVAIAMAALVVARRRSSGAPTDCSDRF